MRRKIITAFLIIAVLFIILISSNELRRAEEHGKYLSKKEDLKSIAINIKAKLKSATLNGLNYNQKQIKIDNLLAGLNINSVCIDDLSELKWTYWELYVDPHLDDDITAAIDKIIKNKIDRIIELSIRGKKYSPMEMYIVIQIDPNSYQCRLENGYADDSLHLSEFPETHDPILYNESDVFCVNLDNNFRFVVEPHIYSGHSWDVLKIKNWNNNKFNLSSKQSHAVLFSIIEEKNATKRKYKVFWVVNYDNQPRGSFNSHKGNANILSCSATLFAIEATSSIKEDTGIKVKDHVREHDVAYKVID